MSKEFRVVNHCATMPHVGKAELKVSGEGIWAPSVEITVYVDKTDHEVSVYVYAHTWTVSDNPVLNPYHKHYDSIAEGWAEFQALRRLLGLKGV